MSERSRRTTGNVSAAMMGEWRASRGDLSDSRRTTSRVSVANWLPGPAGGAPAGARLAGGAH
jgi:hypothetical protein